MLLDAMALFSQLNVGADFNGRTSIRCYLRSAVTAWRHEITEAAGLVHI